MVSKATSDTAQRVGDASATSAESATADFSEEAQLRERERDFVDMAKKRKNQDGKADPKTETSMTPHKLGLTPKQV